MIIINRMIVTIISIMGWFITIMIISIIAIIASERQGAAPAPAMAGRSAARPGAAAEAAVLGPERDSKDSEHEESNT